MLALLFAGVGGICWGWVRLLGIVRTSEVPLKTLIRVAVAWSAPLCIAVPLFSGDVFVYYVDGEALARGFNPYQSGVSALGPTEMVHMVHELWRTTTTMYGPVFMRLAQGVAEISGGSVVTAVLIFRAIAVLSVIGMAASVVAIARGLGRPAGQGFVFAVMNPLTLLHLLNGAHNDATMLALLMGGLAFGVTLAADKTKRVLVWRMLAIAFCVTGAMFKIPAFAGVLVLGWMWCSEGSSIAKRMIGAAVAGAVGLVLFELLTLASGLGWGWTASSDVPGLAHPLLAPANAVPLSFGGLFGNGFGLNSITRGIATFSSVIFGTWLIFRTGRHGTNEQLVRALGWAVLAIAWLGPALYPWYLTWGVVIVGAIGIGRLEKPLTVAIILVTFLIAPGGYGFLDLWADWRRTATAFVVTAAYAWAIWSVVPRKIFGHAAGLFSQNSGRM